jgi:hypothetical protein
VPRNLGCRTLRQHRHDSLPPALQISVLEARLRRSVGHLLALLIILVSSGRDHVLSLAGPELSMLIDNLLGRFQ